MSGSGVEAGGGTPLGGVVRIDDGRIQAHLDEVVRSTVEEAVKGGEKGSHWGGVKVGHLS